MAFGSGLSAQLMVAPETTVGTAVTPTVGYEFLSETFQNNPTFLEGDALKAGQTFDRTGRSVISRQDVNGGFTIEHGDRGHHELQWKHALGSALAAPVLITGTAYKSILIPGPKTGLSQTIQLGRPNTGGTVQAFTYNGVKTSDWAFSCSDNQIAQLALTMDGWAEATATALAAAAYTAGVRNFTFADCVNFKIGGTASTTGGETTITGGTAVASIVKGINLAGTTPMAVERYGLGNAGTKKEQIENAKPTVTGSLDSEFTNLTEIYSLFKAGTYVPLQIDFQHFNADGTDANSVNAGPNPFLLSFILSAVKFKAAPVQVSGPDIVPMKADFQAYDDGVNPVIQVKIVSNGSTL